MSTSDATNRRDQIDFLALYGVILRHLRFVLVSTGVVGIAAVAFSVLSLLLPPKWSPLPNEYRAEALIMIQQNDQSSLSSLISSTGAGALANLAGISDSSTYSELAVKLLGSRSIVDVIADEFGIVDRYRIRKYPVTQSRKKILDRSQFTLDAKTSTVSIRYEDFDPDFSARVVNRMVELLDQRFSTLGIDKNLTKKQLLEVKLADVMANINSLETDIKAFQVKHGALTVESLAVEQVNVAAQLRSQIILKEVEIKTYAEFSKIDDPALKRLKSERENLSTLLREVEQGFSTYEDVLPSQRQLPDLAQQFLHLQRDLTVQEKVYELLIQQYELVKLDADSASPVFQVLELADPPDKKSGPSRALLCAAVTALGFVLSVSIVLLRHSIARVKADPESRERLRGA